MAKSPIPGRRDDPLAWVGVELDGYRLGRLQHEDLWGRTYALQGVDRQSQECVVFDQGWAQTVRMQEAFVLHLGRLEQFVHPNKPLYIESGLMPVRLHAPTPYVVRERMPQTSLAALLGVGKERLEYGFVFAIVRQIADVLEAAANFRTDDGTLSPLFHGGFRPADVRLTVINGVARIALVGFERLPFLAAAAGQAFANVRGKVIDQRDAAWLAYVAPELIRERGASGAAADERTDVYCLGMLMFETLTGRLPVNPERSETGESFLNRFHATKAKAAVRLYAPDVPEALSDLVMRCLLPHNERPENAQAVARAVAAILKADPRDPRFDTVNVATVKRVMEEEQSGTRTPQLPPPQVRKPLRAERSASLAQAVAESRPLEWLRDGRLYLFLGLLIAGVVLTYALVFQSQHWFGRGERRREPVPGAAPRPTVARVVIEMVDADVPVPESVGVADAGSPTTPLVIMRMRCYAAAGLRTEAEACRAYRQLVPVDRFLDRLREIRHQRRARPGRAPPEPDEPPPEEPEPPTSGSAPSP